MSIFLKFFIVTYFEIVKKAWLYEKINDLFHYAMNFFVITLFSFTLALHLFILEAAQYSLIALLGRPTSWEAEYRLEVDYDTCCQEMCRSNDSCKSYDQIWQPSHDIYECRFYNKTYQVLKAEGEKLQLVPRVQYYSKMYKDLSSCEDWKVMAGAHVPGMYDLGNGVMKECTFVERQNSCQDVIDQGRFTGDGFYDIFLPCKYLVCKHGLF